MVFDKNLLLNLRNQNFFTMTKLQITLKTLLVFLALSILTLSSCKKDDDDTSTPTPAAPAPILTKKELLTGKYWKWTAGTVSPAFEISPGLFVTDFYASQPACAKDNITLYTSNGDYVTNEGPLKCDVSDPQTISGTWYFNAPETILSVLQSGAPIGVTIGGDYTLLQLDATTLKYQFTLSTGVGGGIYTFTSTFTKQ